MVQAVASAGYDAVSVRQVIVLAGVSRRSFYEQFASKEECFLSAFDLLTRRRLAAADCPSSRAAGDGASRLAAALDACAESVVSEPDTASFVLVEAATLGPPGAVRMRAAAGAWESRLSACLAGTALVPEPVGATVSGLLGGVHGIIAASLRNPAPPGRRRLAEQLRWWALARRSPSSAGDARRLSARLRDGIGRGRVASAHARARRSGEPRGERERLLAAALRLAARHPPALLSAAQICDECGLPPEAFFDLFADRDECLRAALGDTGERLLAIAAAAQPGPGWPRALRDAIAGLLTHLAAHPLQARAVTVLAPCAGARCRSYGLWLEGEMARLLGAGFPRGGAPAGEALVGAVWHLVRCHLADRRIRELGGAADHLALLALAPALGADGAAAALLDED
jgi:AcrR family transcriptional regulator